jgi:type I restriction enzyme S subunit
MDKYNEYEWIQVPYKEAIDKISTNNKKVKQKEYISDGKYPVIDQGQDFIGGFTNDESKLLDCTLPALVFGDHTKVVKLVNYNFAPGADGVKVVVPVKFFNAKLFEFFTKILALKIPDKGYARHFQYIEKSEIPLPPLPEQRAIVAKIEQLFSDLDNGIVSLKKAQEQLKIYRQAVLKKAFEGELTKKWREEQTDLPSAEELLQQIKEERVKHYQKQLDEWKQAVKEWEDKGKEGKKPTLPKKTYKIRTII